MFSEKAYNAIETEADMLLKIKYAYYHNFKGGASWCSSFFSNLHTWPSNPAGAIYSIEDNIGKVMIAERMQGNGSAFGRATPVMRDWINKKFAPCDSFCITGSISLITIWTFFKTVLVLCVKKSKPLQSTVIFFNIHG
ncbi:hypothetical protein [Virgibacillus kimchii]